MLFKKLKVLTKMAQIVLYAIILDVLLVLVLPHVYCFAELPAKLVILLKYVFLAKQMNIYKLEFVMLVSLIVPPAHLLLPVKPVILVII